MTEVYDATNDFRTAEQWAEDIVRECAGPADRSVPLSVSSLWSGLAAGIAKALTEAEERGAAREHEWVYETEEGRAISDVSEAEARTCKRCGYEEICDEVGSPVTEHPITLVMEEHDPRSRENPFGVRWLPVAVCTCGCDRRWTLKTSADVFAIGGFVSAEVVES